MRDENRIREKIELTLDTRQVVSIVLGSAVVLGIVFYLGVTVGKDLSVGRAPPPTDPLERLDQQALVIDEKITFPEALTDEVVAEADSPSAPEKRASPEKAEPARAAPKADEAPRAPDREGIAEGAAPKEAPIPAVASAAQASAASKEPSATPPPKPAPAAPAPKGSAAVASSTSAPKPPPAAEAGAGKEAYTVQVAAFPSRQEADALVGQLRRKGFAPTVVKAEVPGKGTFYRVRVGRFRTREEASRYLEDLRREARLDGFVTPTEG
ncbi:SPOR domain-containing protein [Vulgatibacter incomptus]|uniref:SPOR domain-containing protein n=1 Tax=Vulgatibacter incomptus TaxID=1391653 RepID=A0A0K1PD35_9BACT|nr:SPOR domain-containing protein [Vulgatibacter incomptus]AKU91034.1 hypothetical protein AKJ08_1421 [Vulgatibacter incomptus]